uniref:CS domain-containing protein n=1 Tax=Ditylum brightwellii TaxID=49249 RepID=A0A7S1YWH3_9STRA|mmetsp:Transcript_18978/g.28305  ORF Transcript_18978/g.28305 Transcript_18978/m.28305 type:complete len:355 (+) Transcript_18978:218-1282(+)
MIDQIRDLYRHKIAPNITPEVTAALIFALACTVVYYHYSSHKKTIKNQTSSKDEKKPQATPAREDSKQSAKPKDIFETMRDQRKKGGGTAGSKKLHPSEKPFGSSYYYAHNNPNAKGGYSDGLAAEDYVMNGPKLLAKGGVRVVGENRTDDEEEDLQQTKEEEVSNKEKTTKETNAAQSSSTAHFIPISKYMWDDDGTNGMARIYIEHLPVSPSTDPPLRWEGCGIKKEDVEAKLLGEDGSGLLVRIRQKQQSKNSSSAKSYQLHVPKMHGQASEVKTIVKAKRLIIKITKKRNGIWDSGGNTKAWPYLSASTSAASTDTIPIDTNNLTKFDGKLGVGEKDEMMDFYDKMGMLG